MDLEVLKHKCFEVIIETRQSIISPLVLDVALKRNSCLAE